MMNIDKNYFLKQIKIILNEETNVVDYIQDEDIDEFIVGKNYFYSLKKDSKLHKVHKWLNEYFQNNSHLNNSATAFRKQFSYLNLFEPHTKNYHFLRLDIRSFFHSIQIDDIRKSFEIYFKNEYIDDKKKQLLVDSFIKLVTYIIPENSSNDKFKNKQILPIGFRTSPVISNIIFRKLDIQIQKLCIAHNIIYTRYADDMLFSSTKDLSYVHSEHFMNEISIILWQMNFRLNKHKTIKSKHTISLNGYTIQYSQYAKKIEEKVINEFRLSNKKINIIKKMIHMINVEKKYSWEILKRIFNYKLNPAKFKYPAAKIETIEKYYDDQLLNKLTGYRSYLLSVVIFNNKYHCCQEDTIKKYIVIIEDLNKIITVKSNAL